MVITRQSTIPKVIYNNTDLVFDRTITLNGETLATLSSTSAKFGLKKTPITTDSINALSSNGVISSDVFKFDISDNDMDLESGKYVFSIEFTDTDNKKYVAEYGELIVKDSTF